MSKAPAASGLGRFVEAQSRQYDGALAELRNGHKRSHWIWYIFPQLAGLGHSPMAQFYAIADLNEAQLYLADPLLGPRLNECVDALLPWGASRSASRIMGEIDAIKLRSSMTLFDCAAMAVHSTPIPFAQMLQLFYGDMRDERTLNLLGR